MRKSTISSLVALVVILGCSKSDPAPTPAATGLVGGSWVLTSFVQSACADPAMNKTIPCNACKKTITFNSDGSYYESDDFGGFPGTYSVNGTNITFDDVSSGPTETYPFTVSATTLTLVTFVTDCTYEEVYTRK
jgi:hypothetical protein